MINKEEEKRLKGENSRRELKAILIIFTILLNDFVTFCYFFFNYIEEKAAGINYDKRQKQRIK